MPDGVANWHAPDHFPPMRRVLFLVAGWGLLVFGVLITPTPIPVPLIGVVPMLVGAAILTTHSKFFRRALTRARHRFQWISHFLEGMVHRTPAMVKHMVRRTNPHVLHRHARLRARKPKPKPKPKHEHSSV